MSAISWRTCCPTTSTTDMELEQLRIFAAAVDCGGFSQAARKLFLSHSTVSRAVAALEAELGVRLIDRDNHIFALTEAGESLRKDAGSLLEAARAAQQRCRAFRTDL